MKLWQITESTPDLLAKAGFRRMDVDAWVLDGPGPELLEELGMQSWVVNGVDQWMDQPYMMKLHRLAALNWPRPFVPSRSGRTGGRPAYAQLTVSLPSRGSGSARCAVRQGYVGKDSNMTLDVVFGGWWEMSFLKLEEALRKVNG